jgi:hypothetical protein
MPKLSNWLEAREALKKDKTVYRQAWNFTKLVAYVPNTETTFEGAIADWRGKKGTWVPCVPDMFNDDWIIE